MHACCRLLLWLPDCCWLSACHLQEKFKRGFRRLFRRCSGPPGRDRRFSSSAGDLSLTGAFHVEDVDAGVGPHRAASRRRAAPRGSDASSINLYDGQRPGPPRSAQLTPVAVHRQPASPQPSHRPTSGTHLSVTTSVRYWPVNAAAAAAAAVDASTDDVELWSLARLCSSSIIGTFRIVAEQDLWNGTASVRLSVRLSPTGDIDRSIDR